MCIAQGLRANQRASERRSAGTERERERGADRRDGPVRERALGKGCRTAARAVGPRPSPRRLSLNSTGCGTGAGCRLFLVKCPSRSETPAACRPQEVYSQLLF